MFFALILLLSFCASSMHAGGTQRKSSKPCRPLVKGATKKKRLTAACNRLVKSGSCSTMNAEQMAALDDHFAELSSAKNKAD